MPLLYWGSRINKTIKNESIKKEYGTLPDVEWEGRILEGWFTKNGEKITETTNLKLKTK